MGNDQVIIWFYMKEGKSYMVISVIYYGIPKDGTVQLVFNHSRGSLDTSVTLSFEILYFNNFRKTRHSTPSKVNTSTLNTTCIVDKSDGIAVLEVGDLIVHSNEILYKEIPSYIISMVFIHLYKIFVGGLARIVLCIMSSSSTPRDSSLLFLKL